MNAISFDYIKDLLQICQPYSDKVIEATLIKYICNSTNKEFHYTREFKEYENLVDSELLETFDNLSLPVDIEFAIKFFESLLKKEEITENGIVFTPKYISDYIAESTIDPFNPNPTILDPSCGCGIFLISAAHILHKHFNISYTEIINRYIFGIDLIPENARRCKIILNLFVLFQNESNENLTPNIIAGNSLQLHWSSKFNVCNFSYILGNPPYVNTHDMAKEMSAFLKSTFQTTQNGVYNIFYAFIEHAMKFLNPEGKLGYIVPNNFLTIKSAKQLRQFITDNLYLEAIIDFSDNMVFKPVRTYNCIIYLSKKNNLQFRYSVIKKVNSVEECLSKISFNYMDTSKLSYDGWNFSDELTLSNIKKIEGQFFSIKELIRTGIATLRDEIYTVDYDGVNYFKIFNNKKYVIEEPIVKRLYKVPELKKQTTICSNRYIIFPYQRGDTGFEIIPEKKFSSDYPLTYKYLLSRKKELDSRDKGKGNPVAWYAYGRTQGLNKYGKKLLFPTFASTPRFTLTEDSDALFCNGYAVFESDCYELTFLARILNSDVMNYYIRNTSYTIEGGYYCYQKKYVEKFTVPYFTPEEISIMEKMDTGRFNSFLKEKYHIEF